MNNGNRVVVTGMGVVSPYGVGLDLLWSSVLAGKSAIDRISLFDASGHDCQVAAEVRNFEPTDFVSKKEVKRLDRFLQFSKAAVKMCMEDSGLTVDDELAPMVGTSIGSGIGGMYTFESTYQTLLEKGPSRISPFFIPMMLINMASGMAAIDYNMKGPCLALVTACASGAHNIGNSYEMIRSGHAKAMLVGSSEASITPLTVGGFAAMKAVSSHNDEPQKASRPFDLNRDGFVMGEGAAILLLEDLEMAKARGARIHAEIVGYGTSSDAYHFTQPEPDGKGAAQAMNTALARAGITPEQIDYINAHGTATPLGDIAETKAIKSVFGDHARKLCVSSSKSMFGHLLGAAGSIEAIISILAIKNDVAPPTINLETPDPECDLDYVANVPQSRPVNYAMSNSFGFGGTNSVLAFAKYKD